MLIIAVVGVLSIPIAIGIAFRLGATQASPSGVVALASWLPLLFLLAVEGRIPKRRTQIEENGNVAVSTWNRRPQVYLKDQISSVLRVTADKGTEMAELYLAVRLKRGNTAHILIQRDPLPGLDEKSAAPSTLDSGRYVAQTLGRPLTTTGSVPPYLFVAGMRNASNTAFALLTCWLLAQMVGAYWSPYCRFMLLALVMASPIVIGVQLGEFWNRTARHKTRATVGFIGLFGGGGLFLWTVTRNQADAWQAVPYGDILEPSLTYGSLYIAILGLSVIMGNAGLNRD